MSNIDELRKQYERLNGPRPANKDYLRQVESELGISLPDDFLRAAAFFDGSGFAVLPLHSIAWQPALNVLSETKRLRNSIGLPNNFLVLGEPAESLLVLDCAGEGKVLWCDAIDASKLGKEPLSREPKIWLGFSEFLGYLLEEEKQDRT